MKIFVEKSSENLELDFTGSATELLKKINVNSEEVLIVRNGNVVTADEILENKDKIELLSVVSGG